MVGPTFNLPNSATVLRRSYEVDPVTQSEKVTRTVSFTISNCHMQQLTQGEYERWQKRETLVTNKLYTFGDVPDFQDGDIVRIDTNSWSTSFVGEYYEFVAVDDLSAGSGNAIKIVLRKIENIASLTSD